MRWEILLILLLFVACTPQTIPEKAIPQRQTCREQALALIPDYIYNYITPDDSSVYVPIMTNKWKNGEPLDPNNLTFSNMTLEFTLMPLIEKVNTSFTLEQQLFFKQVSQDKSISQYLAERDFRELDVMFTWNNFDQVKELFNIPEMEVYAYRKIQLCHFPIVTNQGTYTCTLRPTRWDVGSEDIEGAITAAQPYYYSMHHQNEVYKITAADIVYCRNLR